MEYRLRWADLGPDIHGGLGVDVDRRVLVLNTRDVPADPSLALLIRQATECALGTPYGRALMADKERVLRTFARLDEALARDRFIQLVTQVRVDRQFRQIVATV